MTCKDLKIPNLHQCSEGQLALVLGLITDVMIRRYGDNDRVKEVMHEWLDEEIDSSYQERCN